MDVDTITNISSIKDTVVSVPDLSIEQVITSTPQGSNPIGANINTFVNEMRRLLAESINMRTTPIRNRTSTYQTHMRHYYSIINNSLRVHFNLKAVPVIPDGNCFFRSLSHIIFGDECEHYNIRTNLIHAFQNSPYIGAFCGIQGYNEVTIHQHLTDMLPNNTWGTINELVMFGILAGINVSYVCATDTDPTKWALINVYNSNSLHLPMNPLFQDKCLVLLFHSLNFSGPAAHHYDAIYTI